MEVFDPCTLNPLDLETLVLSLKKTQRAVVVEKMCLTNSFTAGVCFCLPGCPIKRVSAPNIPVPFSPTMGKLVTPSIEQVMATVKQVMSIK